MRLVGVTRSIQLNQEGIGGTETIDNARLREGRAGQDSSSRSPCTSYDQRAGKYLGKMDSCPTGPRPVDRRRSWCWRMRHSADDRREGSSRRQGGADGEQPAAGGRSRAVRVEVRSPDGKLLRHYSGNILLRDGKAEWKIPFAWTDPAGDYTITCRDVLGGQVVRLTVSRAEDQRR